MADATFGRQDWGFILAAQTLGLVLGGLWAMRSKNAASLPRGVAFVAAMALLPFTLGAAVFALLFVTAVLAGVGLEQFGVIWETAVQTDITAYSGSVTAVAGLEMAADWTRALGAEVWVLYVRVWDPMPAGGRIYIELPFEAKCVTQKAVTYLRRRGVAASGIVRGRPRRHQTGPDGQPPTEAALPVSTIHAREPHDERSANAPVVIREGFLAHLLDGETHHLSRVAALAGAGDSWPPAGQRDCLEDEAHASEVMMHCP